MRSVSVVLCDFACHPRKKLDVQGLREDLAKAGYDLLIVNDVILSNKDYMDIILNKNLYYHNSYHMGMVDENGELSFYRGKLRIMAPDGRIVASAQNYGAMNIDIRNVAKILIKEGQVSNGILNMVEMGFRSYDPCFSCATHAAVGQMPMEIVIHDSNGRVVNRIKR